MHLRDSEEIYRAWLSIQASRGPFSPKQFNFNPSMNKLFHPLQNVWWNYLSIPKLRQCNHWNLGMDRWFHHTIYWFKFKLTNIKIFIITQTWFWNAHPSLQMFQCWIQHHWNPFPKRLSVSSAPSHYLNQCWLTFSEVRWHSYWGNFTRDASTINHWNPFENYISRISFRFPRCQWVKPVATLEGRCWSALWLQKPWWNSTCSSASVILTQCPLFHENASFHVNTLYIQNFMWRKKNCNIKVNP